LGEKCFEIDPFCRVFLSAHPRCSLLATSTPHTGRYGDDLHPLRCLLLDLLTAGSPEGAEEAALLAALALRFRRRGVGVL
jgi:hypothetical protein